ncbi:MAG: fibronectin type III domain-containing protein [Oscillospiraceae bacterium]|nr:fibronectin type III domain-containing protein [Oscillospiraceae bacterium]
MRKKKTLSVITAFLLAMQAGGTVFADNEGEWWLDSSAMDTVDTGYDQSTVDDAYSYSAGTGQVNVSISSALEMKSNVDFTAALTGSDGQTMTRSFSLGTGDSVEEVCFKELPGGSYDLKVSAKGFADYEQSINVNSQAASVKLMTGFAEGIDYSRGAHPGILLIGDVNYDGVIDDRDRQQLTDAIDSRTSGSVADLNGDGSIDLVDLEYLAKGYNVTENTQATFETIIPSSVIAASVGSGTYVAGGLLENLFVRSGGVQLATADGGFISSENPVILQFDVTDRGIASYADGIVIAFSEDNPVAKAEVYVDYIDEYGGEYTQIALIENGVHHLLDDSRVTVEKNSDGSIVINLGDQIAIKKVTFKISGLTKESPIAEISHVEFVNGMENKISEAASDIPKGLSAEAGSRSFTLTWRPCVNVTGYEVLISHNGVSETQRVKGCLLKVSTFNGKELANGEEYTAAVQSVNGAWQSGYSSPVTVVPKASKKPDRPDGLSVSGSYRSIRASWKKAKDADWYNVYYKLRSESEYHKIGNIAATSYTVSDLEDKSEYVVYVTAENEYGESGPSLTGAAATTDVDAPSMPRYNLINTGEAGERGQHIISASQSHGAMVNSNEDSNRTAWGTVDHDPNSHYLRNTWDDGGYNSIGSNGLTYEFDEEYTIQTLALHEAVPTSPNLFYTKINYWDANGNKTSLSYNQVSTAKKTDSKGRAYYLIKLPQKAQIKKIQIGLARYLASGNINVSEVYFYRYDTIADDIADLYDDDLHLVLKSHVTQAVIDALRVRLNTPDEVCGEYNPDKELLETELKNAEDILNCKNLGAPVYIHNEISTSDVNRGFTGLNAWQPVGVSAAAGDTITVYVGHNTKKTGTATNLQLVATQYHSESSSMAKVVTTLKVGSNIITIPKIWSIDAESGGALYVQYTGSNKNDRYAVRVSGGVQVPILDLYGVEDESEKLSRAETYMEELRVYTAQLEELHRQYHADSSNPNVNKYDYSSHNCIAGASDILLDNMLLSLPAERIYAGVGSGSVAEKAAQTVRSAEAVEDMLYLFYQHKGLNENAEKEVDRLSKRHLNIRYQRMFSGAFMYAAGNHIGIEWGSASGLLSSSGVVSDSDGRYISGRYFGWGIAHEVGHCINQGSYAVAEITNNYFAQLAQAKDTNSGMRFKYDNIYSKVTSGATGQSSNLATQLGMYWQLHLAYDNSYNYKTYENRSEQLSSLFYARVDSYSRTPSLAPSPGGIGLTLGGGTDQNLMRLACAAAEKDILEFFERWGKIPDSTTIQYASQFEKEKRAICYVNDDARVYRMENPYGGYLGTNGGVRAVGSDTSASAAWNNPAQVNFTLSSENIPENEVLGYEIVRCTTSGGKVNKEVVGFTVHNTFTDYAAGLNNRVVTYEVTVVDKYLYRSEPKTLEPVKIQDDGSLDKTWWTISSKGITPDNIQSAGEGDDDMPCAPTADDPILLAADGNTGTEYTGTVTSNAEITLSFNKTETISGFKYTAGSTGAVNNYSLLVRTENVWQEAASGVLGGSRTVYFENADRRYVSTYEADAVKLLIYDGAGQNISIAELDVLGVTGDNIEFRGAADGTAAIGVLSADYRYGSGENDVIPRGSIVFTGAYKGNPSYNVVMLFDQDGNIVGGTDSEGYLRANQIILADDPGSGLIEEVSEGTWIYWTEPSEQFSTAGISQVRAELYRVNNALTNEGERLVSDTMFTYFPDYLPEITFESNYNFNENNNTEETETEAAETENTDESDNTAISVNTDEPAYTEETEHIGETGYTEETGYMAETDNMQNIDESEVQ